MQCVGDPGLRRDDRVEKSYAWMILDQPHSATVVPDVAKLPSVNTRGVSHTANGENIYLSYARQAAHYKKSNPESFCYRSPKI